MHVKSLLFLLCLELDWAMDFYQMPSRHLIIALIMASSPPHPLFFLRSSLFQEIKLCMYSVSWGHDLFRVTYFLRHLWSPSSSPDFLKSPSVLCVSLLQLLCFLSFVRFLWFQIFLIWLALFSYYQIFLNFTENTNCFLKLPTSSNSFVSQECIYLESSDSTFMKCQNFPDRSSNFSLQLGFF